MQFRPSISISKSWMDGPQPDGEGRLEYANQLELILTLVSYAVGLGNLWRFPYLVYENGGGTFLIPYLCALLTLGIPIFMLELGLGQMTRQGTVNMWIRLGLPKLRGAGIVATWVTFLAAIYYLVIVAWAVFYVGSVLGSIFEGWTPLGWEDTSPTFLANGGCQEPLIICETGAAELPDLFQANGLYNQAYQQHFWCPETGGLPQSVDEIPDGYRQVNAPVSPIVCPGQAAIHYWNEEALQKSDSVTNLEGINLKMLLCHTITWIVIYLIVFKGVAVSGKLSYVTATLPYFCLICFFVASLTLENYQAGLNFYITPDWNKLWDVTVWQKAATQIFFSVGIGWGTIVAFGSYGAVTNDYVGHVTKVALINCGTSIFAGFVIFNILGFLANEMSEVNPCFKSDDIAALEGIGLQGSGLAFVAFPIAISRMGGKYFWAILFFIMLFTLGVGSGFGYIESITTVMFDSGMLRGDRPRWQVAGGVCIVCWLLGLLFVTNAGDYWVKLFDSYSTVVATFVVCFIECAGMMWVNRTNYKAFQAKTLKNTQRDLPWVMGILWGFISPLFMVALLILSIGAFDLTGLGGTDAAFPDWVLYLGWFLGFIPVLAAIPSIFTEPIKLAYKPEETLQEIELNTPLEGKDVEI